LELAVAIMQTETSWRTSHVQGVLLESYPIGQGTVSIELLDVATNLPPIEGADTIRITVRATVEDFTQTIEAIASVRALADPDGTDLSGFAVWVRHGMRLQGHASIRRWNDAPMAHLGRRIFIGTTADSSRSIDIGPGALVVDATLVHDAQAPHGLVRNEGALTLRSREATAQFGPEDLARGLPALTGNTADTGRFNPRTGDWSDHPAVVHLTSGSTFDLPAESTMAVNELELEHGTTLIIHGDTTLAVHGNLLLDQAAIVLAPGARLALQIGGDITIRNSYVGDLGGNVVDDDGSPTWFDANAIQITGVGDSATRWSIQGQSLIKGVIDAPMATVLLRDTAILAGRVVADRLNLRHGASVRYDHALDTGLGATKLMASHTESSQDRVRRRLGRHLDRLAQRLGHAMSAFDAHSTVGTQTPANTGGFNLAADDAWHANPSLRDIPVSIRLLQHGGDTRQWESLVAATKQRPGS
jgi:hypothetical protein